MAELKAVEWAVQLAQQHGWSAVNVESDAQLVIDALNGARRRGFHAQTLVDNIFRMIVNLNIRFSFCYRESNMAAHRLAYRASSSSCISVWTKDYPLWISDLVLLDSSS